MSYFERFGSACKLQNCTADFVERVKQGGNQGRFSVCKQKSEDFHPPGQASTSWAERGESAAVPAQDVVTLALDRNKSALGLASHLQVKTAGPACVNARRRGGWCPRRSGRTRLSGTPSMLAHNGLALITEKLQNQRLEEPAQPSPAAAKLPQVGYESTTKTCQNQKNNLAVKGKNVWALTVESERPGRQSHEFAAPDLLPRPPTLRPTVDKVPNPGAVALPVCCRHKKLRQSCQFCDSAPGTPSAPPKKKHCRSLSVPPDGGGGFAAGSIPPDPSSRENAARLWKPIALIPLPGNSSSSRDSSNPSAMVASGNPPNYPAPGDGTGRWLPKLLGSGLQLVPSASAASSDSGHFTTSDFQTPPGSPVPPVVTRPASASSDTTSSLSSLGSALFECAGGGNSNFSSSSNSRACRGARALQNRSLSYEDRISGSSSPYTRAAAAAAAATNAASMPCVHSVGDVSASSRCRSGSQDSSMSSSGPGATCTGSIPRCHSQPCVLHHRRCGKKRRRNCDRPTLNFNKMTEVS
ncbi:protein fam53a-like [Plakobranchus ocellatus]|uniref:Protein fam53a-like n=1 Tax=Plakobranchus ocellatus TaxID=259542 RepID=A0AAV4DPJ1_9GAST|nr:protein fam53a-like [Plakobranchus ocellatus]